MANLRSVSTGYTSPLSLSQAANGPKKERDDEPEANLAIWANSDCVFPTWKSSLAALTRAESPEELEDRPAAVGMLFQVSILTCWFGLLRKRSKTLLALVVSFSPWSSSSIYMTSPVASSGRKDNLVSVYIFSKVSEILLVEGIIRSASALPQYLTIAIFAYDLTLIGFLSTCLRLLFLEVF